MSGRDGGGGTGDSRAANPPLLQIGDYRILREIGRGGMGVVYEAEQISLGRQVALKVLPGQVSGDRMVQERFRREARAAARLHHTNIVPVYEVGQDGDVRFYAMQFIQGIGARRSHHRAAAAPRPGRIRVQDQRRPPRANRSGKAVNRAAGASRNRQSAQGVEVSAVLQIHPFRSVRPWRPGPGARRRLSIDAGW